MKKLFLCLICGIVASLSLHAASPKWALKDVKANSEFHDGRAVFSERVVTNGNKMRLYGAIGTDGVVKIRPQFKKMEDFKNGVSVVQMPNGKYGIINIHGKFILNPIYSKIEDTLKPGVYEIMNDYKYGIFADGRLIIPVEYSSVDGNDYPFITFDYTHLNVTTGEKWQSILPEWHFMQGTNGVNHNSKYYYKDGTPVREGDLSNISSKGLKLVSDGSSKKVVLKDTHTGKIFNGVKYLDFGTKWFNDAILLREDGGDMVILGAGGEKLRSASLLITDTKDYDDEFCRLFGPVAIRDLHNGLYSAKGEIIIPPNIYRTVNHIAGSWFELETENGDRALVNIKTKQEIKNYTYCTASEGMILITSKDGSYYINSTTGQRLNGRFEYAYNFSEGVALVRLKGNEYYDIIDKKGKIVLTGSAKCAPCGNCSEGVIPVEYNYSYGYIYNPLGDKKYKYNQKSASNDMLNKWMEKGLEEFNKGNYSKAKNYFYNIMITNPFDVFALSNYASCLNNMGYYDEAISAYETALDIDPKNEFAKKELQRSRENKQIVANSQQVVAEENQSNTFWDALSSFGQILMQATGGGNANYQPINSFSNDYIDNSNSSSGSGINWQAQYSRWENEAKSLYDRLTSSGLRVKDNQGNMSGTNAGNVAPRYYIGLKQNLRRAQSEMRKIRQKARQDGITIPESKYESAAVSY